MQASRGRKRYTVHAFSLQGRPLYFSLFLKDLHRDMDPATLQVFQQELTCPICMNFFLDPVRIDCGHNFCRSCLSLSWEEAETPMCCPMCKEMSEKTNFKTNVVLKKLASAARKYQLNQVTRLQEQVPGEQTEAAGLLTEVDKSLHYQPLSGCPQPEIHDHTMMECAAEESRVSNASRAMWILWDPELERKVGICGNGVEVGENGDCDGSDFSL